MSGARCVRKEIRLSENEAKRIEKDAKERGMNFSQYIRFLVKNKPNEHIEVIKLFKQLINEINHIGNNINQIARNCNSGIYTYEDRENLYICLGIINTTLNKVLKKYGEGGKV